MLSSGLSFPKRDTSKIKQNQHSVYIIGLFYRESSYKAPVQEKKKELDSGRIFKGVFQRLSIHILWYDVCNDRKHGTLILVYQERYKWWWGRGKRPSLRGSILTKDLSKAVILCSDSGRLVVRKGRGKF